MNEQMDCTSSLLSTHERPVCVESYIEPKRQKLDSNGDENFAGNSSRTKRLAQLQKDIAILEAAVRRGQETMEKMLNIAVEDMGIDPLLQQEELLKRRHFLIAEITSTQNAVKKKNRVERLQNGSLMVDLLDHVGKSSSTPFIKVEAWELMKCGCDFCGLHSSSRIGLPPRV